MSTSAGRGYHHGELRTVLVSTALALLAEAGADALSLRAVARRAGVSAMAPYRHYADKEALLAAVAAHGFEGLRDVLRAADRQTPALVAQAVAYVGYALENPALFRLMFGARRLDMSPELTVARDAAYAVLADRVAAEVPAELDREARMLGCWSLVHGLALLFLDGRIGEKVATPVVEVTRRVAEIMLGTSYGSPSYGTDNAG